MHVLLGQWKRDIQSPTIKQIVPTGKKWSFVKGSQFLYLVDYNFSLIFNYSFWK